MIRTMVALAVAGAMIGGYAEAAPAKAKPAAKAATYRAPRGPDGVHPDLNGVWQTMNNAGWDIEPHAARAALQLRPGPVVPVPAKEVVALGAVGAVGGRRGVGAPGHEALDGPVGVHEGGLIAPGQQGDPVDQRRAQEPGNVEVADLDQAPPTAGGGSQGVLDGRRRGLGGRDAVQVDPHLAARQPEQRDGRP